jgi:hypothetical protein
LRRPRAALLRTIDSRVFAATDLRRTDLQIMKKPRSITAPGLLSAGEGRALLVHQFLHQEGELQGEAVGRLFEIRCG